MKTLVIGLLLILQSSAYAYTRHSTGNDLTCSITVSADYTTFPSFSEYATLVGGTAIQYAGPLSAGMSETVNVSSTQFKGYSDNQQKLIAMIDQLNLIADVNFENGRLEMNLSAQGEMKSLKAQTNWEQPESTFNLGQVVQLNLNTATPFNENDKVVITLTCRPGSTK